MSDAGPDPWSGYWEQQRVSAACLPGAPAATETILASGWTGFARDLSEGDRILDIGCGNGAVLACMSAEKSFDAVGIDRAELPHATVEGFRLQGGTDAGALPFADNHFMAVTSQFGIEYAGESAVHEAVRVAARGARLRLVMHHRSSVILNQNLRRRDALDAVRSSDVLAGTQAGNLDRSACRNAMLQLWRANRHAPVIEEIAAAMDQAFQESPAGRGKAFDHIGKGLLRELAILGSLQDAAKDKAEMATFCSMLSPSFSLDHPQGIILPDGQTLAWLVTGKKAG